MLKKYILVLIALEIMDYLSIIMIYAAKIHEMFQLYKQNRNAAT